MKLAVVFGTRPEAIKLGPLIKELKSSSIPTVVIHTNQHKDIALPILSIFDCKADVVLDIDNSNVLLPELLAILTSKLAKTFVDEGVTNVLVHGDTTTCLAASLAAFNLKLPVYHVEAGLRTGDLAQPFPEEANRRLTDSVAKLLFAPTDVAYNNLKSENATGKIFTVGNTIVDAVAHITEHRKLSDSVKNYVLWTMHRRENHTNIPRYINMINELAEKYTKVNWVISKHPNPIVSNCFDNISKRSNILVVDNLPYDVFINKVYNAKFIVTDSGGLQEEGVILNKKVLVLRDVTERPEGVESGHIKLLSGSDIIKIHSSICEQIESPDILMPSEVYGRPGVCSEIIALLKEEMYID